MTAEHGEELESTVMLPQREVEFWSIIAVKDNAYWKEGRRE